MAKIKDKVSDTLVKPKADRRLLTFVPTRKYARNTVDRRSISTKPTERTWEDFKEIEKGQAGGKRYLVDYDVKITINELLNGTITFEYNGKPFQATRYGEQKSGIEISDKEIDRYFRQKSTHKPSYRHPWSQARRAETRMRQYQGQ